MNRERLNAICRATVISATTFTTEKADRLMEKYRGQTVGVIYNIMSLNDTASGCVFDAMNEIRRSGLYRYRVKQLERQIEKCRLKYERVLNGVIKDCNVFLAEYLELFGDDLDVQLQTLYWTIKNMYDRECVEDSHVKACVKMAFELTGLSVCIFDRRMEEMRREDIMFARFNLSYLRLTELFRLMEMLDKELCPDLPDKAPVVTSLTAICNMLSDGERIVRQIKQVSDARIEEDHNNNN